MSVVSDLLGGDQTTKSSLPKWQQDLLRDALADYQSAIGGDFSGRTVAGFDPMELQGQQMLQAFFGRGGPGQHLISGATGAANRLTSGEFLDPANNPTVALQTQALEDSINKGLTRFSLPNARSEGVHQNALGSSRQGIAEGLAVSDATGQLAQGSASILGNAFNQGARMFQDGIGLSQQALGLGMQPGMFFAGAGAQNRALDQARRDTAFNNQFQDLNLLNSYLAAISGVPGGGSSTTTGGNNPLVNTAVGAGLGFAIGGPPGAAAGGAAGATS